MKVTINWTEKEIEFKAYTRKIDREFNDIMFEWMQVTPWQLQTWDFKIDIAKFQKANDFAIVNMTNLTQDELDELSNADYNNVLAEVEKLKIPSKK